MEHAIDKYFGLIIDRLDKLECSLFGNTDDFTHNGDSYYRSFLLSEANIVLSDFLNHLEIQVFFGLLFNIFLVAVLFIYIPANLSTCMSCSSLITIWLTIMGLISTLLVIPKMILLRKLIRIEESIEGPQTNYYLWTYFHSKAFKFNKGLGDFMLGLCGVGFLLFYLTELNSDVCQSLFGLIAFLLLCIGLSIIFNCWKFNILTHSWRLETLFQAINDSFAKEIQSLKIIRCSDYQKKFSLRDLKNCSICREAYKSKSILRVMKCPGSHAFHKECIDKWLFKSARCPECNCNVLGKHEGQNDI